MAEMMVDSNVLLDVLTEDPAWCAWSSSRLEEFAEQYQLVINPIVYAEISIGFERIEDLDEAVPESLVERRAIPWEAAFLAGKCFLRYRRHGGRRSSPLPDFFIGAHAAVLSMPLLTRDQGRYRKYFPQLKIISPSRARHR